MFLSNLFAVPVALALAVSSNSIDMDYEGEVDVYTGQPVGSEEAVNENIIPLSDGSYYDAKTKMFKYNVDDANEGVAVSVPDGAVTTSAVSLTIDDTVHVKLYKDGKALDGTDFSTISAFGAYAVVATGTDSEERLTSFTVTPVKTGMVSSLRLPSDFEITEVSIDGAPQFIRSSNTVDFTEEGSYVVSYSCVPADKNFGLKLVIDHTPPQVVFEGVENGEARGPVKITGLEKSDTIELTRDGKKVSFSLDNTLRSPGDYVAIITDDAGNSVTEKFTIGMYLNYQGLLFGLLAIAVIAAAAIYMYLARKRLKVR